MPELTERDWKLIQYLNEAYGKEKELEMALEAHIGMTTRRPYKKRLQQHLRETKAHARNVERRIKRLGGQPQTVQKVAGKAMAAAKGPLHALRGTGEEEKLLKNAKTEYSEEAEEIATYTALEAFAESVGDRETAKLARGIKREEERMASYLERLIPQLTRSVARSEVPVGQRRDGRRRSSSRRRTGATKRSRTTSKRSTPKRSTSKRSTGSSRRTRSTTRSRGTRARGGARRGGSGQTRRSAGGTRRSAGGRRSTGTRRRRS